MLDFNTCTMRDVIAQSALMHPTLFAYALIDVKRVHSAYARVCHNRLAKKVAENMASALGSMIADLHDGSFDVAKLSFSQRIQAFHAAAKLQLIPPATREDIVERESA